MTFELPKRSPVDGPCGVDRVENGDIALNVTTNRIEQGIVMSDYNAARSVVMLCMLLGVKPPAQLGKLPL